MWYNFQTKSKLPLWLVYLKSCWLNCSNKTLHVQYCANYFHLILYCLYGENTWNTWNSMQWYAILSVWPSSRVYSVLRSPFHMFCNPTCYTSARKQGTDLAHKDGKEGYYCTGCHHHHNNCNYKPDENIVNIYMTQFLKMYSAHHVLEMIRRNSTKQNKHF